MEHLTTNLVHYLHVINMIKYKKSIPESLLAVKMERGSPPSESLHGQIEQQFSNYIPQCKIEIRNKGFYHIHSIITLKDSANLKKSLYARKKNKNQYRMAVILKPSDSTALKTDMILQWN